MVSGAQTIREFCTDFRISRATFYRLARDGRGPKAVRIGRKVLIPRAAAEQWLRDLQVSQGAAA